jgi:hypothetical protein
MCARQALQQHSRAFPLPWGRALSRGRGGSALPGGLEGWGVAGFSCRRWMPGRNRGQAGAPRWTNDLAAGEDRRRIGWLEGPDDLPELAHTHPFGPEVGPHDDGIRAGLLSQVNGRVAGSSGTTSAPGLAFSSGRGRLDLLEDVEAAGQQPTGDRHGGDLGASAASQLAVGTGKLRTGLGGVGRPLAGSSAPRTSPAW